MTPVQMLPIAAIGLLVFSVLLIAGGVLLRRGEGKSDEKRIARQKKELMEAVEGEMPPSDMEKVPDAPVSRPHAPLPPEPQIQPAGQPVGNAIPTPAQSPNLPPDEVEILQVRRSMADGRLALRVFGQAASSPADLSAEQQEKLKRVLVEMYKWMGKPGTAGQSQAREESPQVATQALPEAPEPPSEPPHDHEPTEIAADVPFADTLPKAPELRDRLTFSRRPKPKLSEPPPPPKSIVEQIDSILQVRLARSALAGREIRMVELPGEGMMIVDGAQKYHGLDEVQDPELLALLRASVKEWDEKNKLRPNSHP